MVLCRMMAFTSAAKPPIVAAESGSRMQAHRSARAIGMCVALAFAASGLPARAQTIELKISHFLPPNHTFHKWVSAWSERLAQESGGKLKFTIYPNGQLVGPPNRQ